MKRISRIKLKKLPLKEALILASAISKRIDLDKITPSTNAIDFVSLIVDKISPQEYLQYMYMMTNIKEQDIKKHISINLLTAFVEGLKLNQIFTLLSFWKDLKGLKGLKA